VSRERTSGASAAARPAVDALDHPALGEAASAAASPLAEAACTDRAKLGVVLQGASLLSLCETAGWTLAAGWSGARVDATGALRAVQARPGRDRFPVQTRLLELLLALFRANSRVAGRGEARRAARTLAEMWESALVPMSGDDAIGILFDTAPFLWEPEFGVAHAALKSAVLRGGRRTDWIAGPPEVRRRLAPAERTGEAAAGSAAAASTPARGALELALSGRWAEATRLWRIHPPETAAGRLELARSLYALGRFEAAQQPVADRDDTDALALRAGCRLLLGELAAARELVERLLVRELDVGERLEHGDVVLRVLALAGDRDAARDFGALALAGARTARERALAQLLLATAALDAGDDAGAERRVAEAESVLEAENLGWRAHEVRAWIAIERGDGASITRHARALLAGVRRRMRRFEAGRAWNNLGLGLLEERELRRAERAFEQSVRLLRRCDGPLAVTLPQSNLAETRLRAGKLLDVEPILRASSAHNRRSGNRRGLAVDEALRVRLDLVRGQGEAALERARAAFENLAGGEFPHLRALLAALAARAAGWSELAGEAERWIEAAGQAGERELEPEEIPGWLALAGRTEEARRRAAGGAFAAVWAAALRGDAPSLEAFAPLAGLEPFRRARLTLDVELVLPGAVPAALRGEAAAVFRRLGASRYAALLERGERNIWTSLRSYCELAEGREAAAGRARELLSAIGHPGAEVTWRPASGEAGESIWIPGSGRVGEELSAAAAGGTLTLRAATLDDPLRAVFALLARDFAAAPPPVPRDPAVAARRDRESGILGRSPVLLAALDRLRQFAASDMPVLILGESGTGKELAAREVRRASGRAAKPWVPINCAALSETLLLSDLFGHARGAFTGADRVHAGVFESANGGTVFLDEIGDLPLTAQGNLLRVLQEGEVRRLGETLPRKVDFRLVTATHRDLAALVREGRFRQDLFYRLKVCTVTLPPLRERGDDVGLIAEAMLEGERRRLGRPQLRFSSEARKRLAAHGWPGNIRELEHVIRAAAALTGDGPIAVAALDLETSSADLPASDYHRDVDEYRRMLIRKALAATGGHRAAAARRLGITRQALAYNVRELGLEEDS
jgi:DNA-binding NtrC family response regulator